MDTQLKLEAKQREEERWAINEAANIRALELLEREKQRKAREMAVQIRRENQLKALEDKSR